MQDIGKFHSGNLRTTVAPWQSPKLTSQIIDFVATVILLVNILPAQPSCVQIYISFVLYTGWPKI